MQIIPVIADQMHALFHIRSVIIPKDRYRPEGFSPRVGISRGMTTVLIWKKACIDLFITYFNIELKRRRQILSIKNPVKLTKANIAY
jgi:hypothetical protein